MFLEGTPFEILVESGNLYEKPFIGGMVSYVIVRHGLQRFKSVPRKGQAPVWNQRFQFSKTYQDELIRIVVLEEGTFWDSKIGEAAIEISKLQLSGRVILPLSNEGVAAGQITISMYGGITPYQYPMVKPQIPMMAPLSPTYRGYAPQPLLQSVVPQPMPQPMMAKPLVQSYAPQFAPQYAPPLSPTIAPQQLTKSIAPQFFPQAYAPQQRVPGMVPMKASLPTNFGPKYI